MALDLTQPIDLKKAVTPPSITPTDEEQNTLQTPFGAPAAVPPVTPGVAPAAAPVVAPAAPQAFNPNAYLGGLFNQAPPAPVYNIQNEEALRSMAKSQKLGEFFQLLGDTYGVSKGAPVAQRQMTSSAPYLQKILENRQKHEADMQAFREREFARKMQLATGAARQAQFDRQFQESQNSFKETQQAAAERAGQTKLYQEHQMDASDTAADLAKKKYETDQSNFKTNTGLAEQRIAKMGAGTTPKDQRDRTIKTATRTYTMSPSDYSYARDQALQDPNIMTKHPEFFSQTAGKRGRILVKLKPTTKDDDLVRYYQETQEAPANVPAQQGAVDPTTGLPYYTAPTSPVNTAPVATSTTDNKYNFAKPATAKPAAAAAGVY